MCIVGSQVWKSLRGLLRLSFYTFLGDNPQILMVSMFEQCSAGYLHDPFEVGYILTGAFYLLLCTDLHYSICQTDILIGTIRTPFISSYMPNSVSVYLTNKC